MTVEVIQMESHRTKASLEEKSMDQPDDKTLRIVLFNTSAAGFSKVYRTKGVTWSIVSNRT